MRKAKKLAAAALAVVMALSMSAPAFAAELSNVGESVSTKTNNGTLTNDTTNPSKGTATTDVKLIYAADASQLSVTVPISVTFAVDANGDFITPDNYTIQNNSRIPVHVTGIAIAKENGVNYEFASEKTAVKTDGTTNNVFLSIAPKRGKIESNNFKADTTDTSSTAVVFGTSTNIVQAKEWNMSANTGDTNVLHMTFDGKISDISADWAANKHESDDTTNSTKGTKVFTITYTVEAGNAN